MLGGKTSLFESAELEEILENISVILCLLYMIECLIRRNVATDSGLLPNWTVIIDHVCPGHNRRDFPIILLHLLVRFPEIDHSIL